MAEKMGLINWEHKASRLANINGKLIAKIEKLEAELSRCQRNFSNTVVMMNHYKDLLEKEKQK